MKKSKRRYKTKQKNKPSIPRKGISKKQKVKKQTVKKQKVKELPLVHSKPSDIAFPKKRKRRSKNPSRMYFTQDTEDAIIVYNKEENDAIRERIFNERIHFPFHKLVENIFNTFKFSYFETGPLDVQKECLSHLVMNMHKYQKRKGRAFAYFSIIAKHYLILLNNTNYKRFNQNMEISEEKDEHTIQLQHMDEHYGRRELSDFMKLMVEFWENNVEKIFTKQRDLNIANAVIELFRNSDRIDAYNKKALYLYIREMAMCKTQQITKVINRMKQYYDNIQETYQEDGIVNTERYTLA